MKKIESLKHFFLCCVCERVSERRKEGEGAGSGEGDRKLRILTKLIQ